MESGIFKTLRRSAFARGAYRPRAIVAIPVRNEEQHLASCLRALGAQRELDGTPISADHLVVLLLLNDCTDDSWACIQSLRDDSVPSWIAIEGELVRTRQHAGGARGMALTKALHLATADTTLIACTDADTQVGPTWLARQWQAIDAGCDAVMGVADILPSDEYALPQGLRLRQRLERSYALWLDRIEAALDPLPHDPWPRHGLASGASLGFRPQALRAMQPLPTPRCGEDRALVERCHALDMKVRGDIELGVVTSGRLQGRATGGMADTLAHRMRYPQAPCDERLEPLDNAIARFTLRGRWRALHGAGQLTTARIADDLHVSPTAAADIAALPTFGLLWREAERHAPDLARRRLRPDALSHELRRASSWYDQFVYARQSERTPIRISALPSQREVSA